MEIIAILKDTAKNLKWKPFFFCRGCWINQFVIFFLWHKFLKILDVFYSRKTFSNVFSLRLRNLVKKRR